MKTSINNATRPYASICLQRDKKDKSLFNVTQKEGNYIPGFLGLMPNEPQIHLTEHLFLEYELRDEEDGMMWSFYTTNFAAITATHTGEYYHGREKLRITSFQLSPENRAYATYGDDAVLISLSAKYSRLKLLFYAGLGKYAPQLFALWEQGLIEDEIA